MRTEMVIRMAGSSEKGHAKAMKVAAAMDGVESVTLSGKDKSLLRVVGDGVDCNHLTTRLRRKVGHADVVELRTLHGTSTGSGGTGAYYGYGSSSRTTGGGSGLTRDAAYSNSGSYYSGYPTATAAAPDYYGQHHPSFQYYQPPPPPYAAPTAVHYEYYPAANDPNGCSIM